MNKQHVTLLVLLHLSAAFDTVEPSILLTRLRSKLGLNGTAFSWFCSYLPGRTQWISVQGALSNVFHLRYGVPQGSCLGPLLFNTYLIKIFDIIGRHLPKVHCYADDSQLYLSFGIWERGSMINLLWPLTHCQNVQCCFLSLVQH